MSYSLDPDQARHFVGADLVPSCLQMLSADDISRQRIRHSFIVYGVRNENIHLH